MQPYPTSHVEPNSLEGSLTTARVPDLLGGHRGWLVLGTRERQGGE
jgi:hypothetical protein